ncbi:MAG TPA: NADH-quinone oxidoreductase subunit J [Candidatus Goldiibacteriota bacterium]|nr:NADH-quinone oxidoreductase subunit J [Candidatus Goldiibacteriota bacterium]
MEQVIFYAFAAMILLSAGLMVTSRNIFHSALYLALCLFGVAGIFVLLNSYFLAGIQVLVYIGAVVILTIFVINLTRQTTGEGIRQMNRQAVPAALVAAAAFALISLSVMKSGWMNRIGESVAKYSKTDNAGLIGRQFLGDFVLPFEIASLILLAALIGAVVIVSKDEGKDKDKDKEIGGTV